MNKIINKFSLTGDKFIPELHLKQPGFTYSTCARFTKHCKRIQKFRETGNLKHLCRNELGKACFPYDTSYSDSKNLANISNKILKDGAYENARNRGYDGQQRALASMVDKFFDQKIRSRISVNEQLAAELHKSVIKKLKRRIV